MPFSSQMRLGFLATKPINSSRAEHPGNCCVWRVEVEGRPAGRGYSSILLNVKACSLCLRQSLNSRVARLPKAITSSSVSLSVVPCLFSGTEQRLAYLLAGTIWYLVIIRCKRRAYGITSSLAFSLSLLGRVEEEEEEEEEEGGRGGFTGFPTQPS